MIIPISINYEQIPEQSVLANEADHGFRSGLSNAGLLSWLQVRARISPRLASFPFFLTSLGRCILHAVDFRKYFPDLSTLDVSMSRWLTQFTSTRHSKISGR